LRAAPGALRREIEARTVDVGSRFPEVARAIHAGDEPERAIRGGATVAEARKGSACCRCRCCRRRRTSRPPLLSLCGEGSGVGRFEVAGDR
jgi:hypothetical protein